MIVLDAYAVIAYLLDEPAATEVTEILRGSTALPAVNVAEVIDQLVRVWRRDRDEVEVALAMMARAGMEVAVADEAIAVEAGRLRAAHYNKRECSISMADCFAAATALLSGAALATSDPHLASVVRAENGQVHILPDSRGHRP